MKKIWIITASIVIIILFASLDYFIPGGHEGHEFWWSAIPAFFLVFGFIGCILLVVIPKFIGHFWLDRKEDYYD